MDCCCCAQGTASLWHFCISPPETSMFPLFLIPGKACEDLVHLAVLLFPENSYWEFQHFTVPAKSIFPFSSLPGKVTGAGITTCMVPWQWVALLPTRMLPGCNPSLPATPKDSKVFKQAIHLLAAD